jgi:hypothetical protein
MPNALKSGGRNALKKAGFGIGQAISQRQSHERMPQYLLLM